MEEPNNRRSFLTDIFDFRCSDDPPDPEKPYQFELLNITRRRFEAVKAGAAGGKAAEFYSQDLIEQIWISFSHALYDAAYRVGFSRTGFLEYQYSVAENKEAFLHILREAPNHRPDKFYEGREHAIVNMDKEINQFIERKRRVSEGTTEDAGDPETFAELFKSRYRQHVDKFVDILKNTDPATINGSGDWIGPKWHANAYYEALNEMGVLTPAYKKDIRRLFSDHFPGLGTSFTKNNTRRPEGFGELKQSLFSDLNIILLDTQ